MADVYLFVDGYRYSGWESVSVTRTIEGLSGAFSLSVAEHRADEAMSWPIREEDECQIQLEDEIVIDGWVSTRNPSFDPESRQLAVSGKDRPSALVECSVVLDRWTFQKKSVVEIAEILSEPYGIPVSVQDGLELGASPAKVVVTPGETAFAVLEPIAKAAGVLIVSDGNGGILITRSGASRSAEKLIEGQNLISGSIQYEASERFSRYIVSSQIPSTDNTSGRSASPSAEAIDLGVRRTDRTLLIRPEKGLDIKRARQRADWEARIRAANAASATVNVMGWKQRIEDGALWPINALVYVYSPTLGIDGDMLISQATHTAGAEDGKVTSLRLLRPDAFIPEPQAKVKA